MSDPVIKITYFDAAGAAEATRLALTIAGKQFEDIRVGREEFMKMKPTLPLGSLPIMEYNGKTFCQSRGMMLAAAQLANLYSTDPEEILAIEQVLGTIDDIAARLSPSFYMPAGEEKLKARKEFVDVVMPRYLGGLEKLLGDKYACGDKLTIADIKIYTQVVSLQAGFLDGIPADAVEAYPKLCAIAKTVGEIEAVQKWNEAHAKKSD